MDWLNPSFEARNSKWYSKALWFQDLNYISVKLSEDNSSNVLPWGVAMGLVKLFWRRKGFLLFHGVGECRRNLGRVAVRFT